MISFSVDFNCDKGGVGDIVLSLVWVYLFWLNVVGLVEFGVVRWRGRKFFLDFVLRLKENILE